MRILFVVHKFPPFGVAGVERVTEQAARDLQGAGHEVTVLAREVTGAPFLPALEQRAAQDLDVRWIVGSTGSDTLARRLDRLDRIFERVLLELTPDVVVISHLMGHSPHYPSIARRWGVPTLLELHDFYVACERAHLERDGGELCSGPERGRACARHCFAGEADALPRWRARTARFAEALASADAVIAPSEFVADYFRRTYGEEIEIAVLPNGVALPEMPELRSRTEPARGGLELAVLGPVVPHKGGHVVVEALRKARLPRVRCTFFGPVQRPYADELREEAEKIAGCEFRMFGPYRQQLVPLLLSGVNALVVPSLVWETFSIVVREAMGCGVPVIAARHGALPDAVRHGENGLLFEPGDSGQLAVLLQDLAVDPELRSRLRRGIDPSGSVTVGERSARLEALLSTIGGRRGPLTWTARAAREQVSC